MRWTAIIFYAASGEVFSSNMIRVDDAPAGDDQVAQQQVIYDAAVKRLWPEGDDFKADILTGPATVISYDVKPGTVAPPAPPPEEPPAPPPEEPPPQSDPEPDGA